MPILKLPEKTDDAQRGHRSLRSGRPSLDMMVVAGLGNPEHRRATVVTHNEERALKLGVTVR